ncbi:MAG: hypothetical protein WCT53_02200 [Candidatus Gracilibacteria bacterium]
MKKIFATICILVLAISLLASCGKSKENLQNQATTDPNAPSSKGPSEPPHIATPPGPPPG